jgi:hypothetical protein
MNAPLSEFDPDDEARLLDLLVDGELDEARRAALLLRCEQQPDLWRRCALAFLEAQAWRGELAGLRRAVDAPPRPTDPPAHPTGLPRPAMRITSVEPAGRRGIWSSTWSQAYALAATLLIACLLGMQARERWSSGGRGNLSPVTGERHPGVEALAEGPRPVDSGSTVRQGIAAQQGIPVQRVGLAGALIVPASDPGQSGITLPVYQGPQFDEHWVRGQPSSFPAELKAELEKRGHKVQVDRQLIPIVVGDGQEVIVGVDEIEVRTPPRYQ